MKRLKNSSLKNLKLTNNNLIIKLMKTIKNTKTGEIKRLEDNKAQQLTNPSVSYLGWVYCAKSEWKSNKSTTTVEISSENKPEKNTTKNGKEKGVSNRGGNTKKLKR
jgi:hypothetical protein